MGRATIFNLVSFIFVVLSVLWIVFVVIRMAGPTVANSQAQAVLPELQVLPTQTPSNTPLPTNTPTDTLTPTTTPSPTETVEPTASPVPSVTITDTPTITTTPSDTPTPLATFTPQPTASPTGPTPTREPTLSPFPFALRENNITFTQNFSNSAGCAWQGIVGQVYDLNNNPMTGGLQVHVFGGDIDRFVEVGTNTLVGAGGWEQVVDTTINTTTYFVELLSAQGTPISDRIQVTFPGDCGQNSAVIVFIQTRPF
jgi:hypothetical protein